MNDKVDDFFERERETVPVLAVPPGRYDELRTVARRRRNRNTTAVSVAAAVVVAVVGTGGVLGSGVFSSGKVSTSTTPAATITSAGPTTSAPVVDPAVPSGFKALSVSFASRDQGWALGSYPCQGGSECVAVVETTNGMSSWHTVARPGFSAAYGVDQSSAILRFVDPSNGWMVGSQGVWSTHDGGHSWRPIAALQAERVDALETHGNYTYAVGRGQDRLWVSSNPNADTDWVQKSAAGLGNADGGDRIEIANRTVAVVRTAGPSTTVRLSPNNGNSWTTIAAPCSPAMVSLIDENTARFVCGDGRVMTKWFDGRHPTKVAGRITLTSTTGSAVVARAVAGDGFNTAIAYTGDGLWAVGVGDDVTRREQQGDFGFVGLTDGGQGIALSATPSGTYWKTINSGSSWFEQSFR